MDKGVTPECPPWPRRTRTPGGALDVLGLICFGSRKKLPEDVKVAIDSIYASLIEIRQEEVVKPRMQGLGPVRSSASNGLT